MTIQILILLAGLALVLLGAEALVDGASALARRWGVSEFVIGLTVVALGTSAPEMVVSFIGAIQGNGDVSVGNVVGSNIFNTALILGLSAVIAPITITRSNLRRDIPINLIVTALLILLGMNGTIFHRGTNTLCRIDGAIFLALFAWYMWVSFRNDSDNLEAQAATDEKPRPALLAALFVIGGLAALIYGGKIFVDSAEAIAKMAGLSDKFIAITVLAAGTSLPELATSCVAAAKGKGQLALGNILGSNTFNILLILGGSALIHPLSLQSIDWVDLGAVLATAVAVFLSAFTLRKGRLDRLEGVFLLLLEAAYMTYLIMTI